MVPQYPYLLVRKGHSLHGGKGYCWGKGMRQNERKRGKMG